MGIEDSNNHLSLAANALEDMRSYAAHGQQKYRAAQSSAQFLLFRSQGLSPTMIAATSQVKEDYVLGDHALERAAHFLAEASEALQHSEIEEVHSESGLEATRATGAAREILADIPPLAEAPELTAFISAHGGIAQHTQRLEQHYSGIVQPHEQDSDIYGQSVTDILTAVSACRAALTAYQEESSP